MKGRNVKLSAIVGCMLLLGSAVLYAEPVSGTVTYLEGTVDVYRGGKLLDWNMVDIGFTLDEYDLVTTGDDGTVEVELTLPSGTGAQITVQPDTSFYFEMDRKGGKSETSFKMLSGAMAYKVQKLAGTEGLSVQTLSAAMGVRGTEFQVVYSPEGGVLVLCNKGKVAVADSKGEEQYSEPGSVVEKVPEKELTSFAVTPSDLSLYRSYWTSARDKVFKAGAGTFIKGFARQYTMFKPRFVKAFAELQKVKPLLLKYGQGSSSYALGTLLKVKGEVSPAVVEMRSVLPLYEMVYYRLKVLQKYHDQGLGHGTIEKGVTTERFFTDFKAAVPTMERQLAEVRYMFKLYSAVHNASGGGPSVLDQPFGGVPAPHIPKSSFPSP